MPIFQKKEQPEIPQPNLEPPNIGPDTSLGQLQSDIAVNPVPNYVEDKDMPPSFESVRQSQQLSSQKLPEQMTTPEQEIKQNTIKQFSYNEVPDKLPKLKSMLEQEITDEEKIKISLHNKFRIEKPMFIRTSHFGQVLQNIDYAKSRLMECNALNKNLAELKVLQDNVFSSYHELLEEIERKLLLIDRTIFKGELI